MERFREFLKKNPIAGYAIVLVLIAAAGYMLASRLFGRGAPVAVTRPAPAAMKPVPAASPAPAATPSPAAPAPAASPAPAATPAPVVQPPVGSRVPSGPVGRVDPFVPLVTSGPSRPAAPPPPSVGLPPPPFPTPGGPPLPPPPLPGGTPPAIVTAPPGAGGAMAVTGIVGDGNAVAIIVVDGRTAIVGAGDELGDLRVVRVDPVRRLVVFSRAGKRFDVRMGGE